MSFTDCRCIRCASCLSSHAAQRVLQPHVHSASIQALQCIGAMPESDAEEPLHKLVLQSSVCLPVRSVLATSPDDGLIECIPSMALANVIAEHRSIARYLALHNLDPDGAAPLHSTGTLRMGVDEHWAVGFKTGSLLILHAQRAAQQRLSGVQLRQDDRSAELKCRPVLMFSSSYNAIVRSHASHINLTQEDWPLVLHLVLGQQSTLCNVPCTARGAM